MITHTHTQSNQLQMIFILDTLRYTLIMYQITKKHTLIVIDSSSLSINQSLANQTCDHTHTQTNAHNNNKHGGFFVCFCIHANIIE